MSGIRDAQVFALVPGAVRGLGDASGFTMEFQNRSGMSRDEFVAAREKLLAAANANPRKVDRMRALGAEVRLEGRDFDAAKAAGRVWAEAASLPFVEDGREPWITEGAGTIGLELLEGDAVYDAVLVPLGNGALLNGMARWLKAAAPATEVVGVSAAGAPATPTNAVLRQDEKSLITRFQLTF